MLNELINQIEFWLYNLALGTKDFVAPGITADMDAEAIAEEVDKLIRAKNALIKINEN